jgi:hypothetical protein
MQKSFFGQDVSQTCGRRVLKLHTHYKPAAQASEIVGDYRLLNSKNVRKPVPLACASGLYLVGFWNQLAGISQRQK